MPSATGLDFKKTPVQVEACRVIRSQTHTALEGGSRSGKTFITIRQIIARGIQAPSRHLATRFRFNHAKTALAMDTIPKVFKLCYPMLPFHLSKSDWFFEWPTQRGGTSELWIGGVDEKDRAEKVLGHEYSTIFANECSQLSYEAILMLQTRLAEKSGLPLRFIYDYNPPSKKHWTYLMFHRGLSPEMEPLNFPIGRVRMNPKDNAENLPAEYMRILEGLPKRQRQRFLEGLFLDDVEGALWSELMVNNAKSRAPRELIKTIVAVDPSVSHTANSDECGIIVASKEAGDGAVVHKDLSGKYSTKQWARKVVNAVHEYNANYVVAEVNQGGDLVENVIHNEDPNVKVKKVRAAVGKFARAEPVAQLYDEGHVLITHDETMPELEDEMTTYVPLNAKYSPNRLDALVWALTDLVVTPHVRVRVG